MGPGSLASTSSVKISLDQAHALDVGQVLAVGGGDACRFLSAMLQRVEPKIGLARGIRMPMNGNHAALFMELVDFGEWTPLRPRLRSEPRAALDGIRFVVFAFDSLKKELPHAEYLAVESGFEGGGPGLAEFSKRSGDQGLAVDARFQVGSARGADARGKEAVLAGQLLRWRRPGSGSRSPAPWKPARQRGRRADEPSAMDPARRLRRCSSGKAACASETAMPPSETSRAEWINLRSASTPSSVCRSASASRSSGGGWPQSRRAPPWQTPMNQMQ